MTSVLPQLAAAELPVDAVEVAYITDAWGVKGWFKVVPYSSTPEAVFAASTWYLQPSERAIRSAFSGTVCLSIRQVRAHGDVLVAQAEGIDERGAAELLRGARVFVSRSAFPEPAADEYYWVDLVGLDVFNREGVALGTVRELLAAGPQTTLVLEGEAQGKPRERLIPFVAAHVDQVDLAGRRILVDWDPDF